MNAGNDASTHLSRKQLEQASAAVARGRVPVLCWEGDEAWVVTRPKSPDEAEALIELQSIRGIRAVPFVDVAPTALIASPAPLCENPDCIDHGGHHWHDGMRPRYFPREGEVDA